MEVCWRSSWQILILFGVLIFSTTLQGVQGESESEGPSESECRPHIEKALKQLEASDNLESTDSTEDVPTVEVTTDDSLLFDDNNDYQPIADSSENLNPIEESEENDVDNDEDEDDEHDIGENDANNESEESANIAQNLYTEYEHASEDIPEVNESNENVLDDEQNDEPLLPESDVDSIFEEHGIYKDETEEEEEESNKLEKESNQLEEETNKLEEELVPVSNAEPMEDIVDDQDTEKSEEEIEEGQQDMTDEGEEEEESNLADFGENIIEEVTIPEDLVSNDEDFEEPGDGSTEQQDEVLSLDGVENEAETGVESGEEISKAESAENVESAEKDDIFTETIPVVEAVHQEAVEAVDQEGVEAVEQQAVDQEAVEVIVQEAVEAVDTKTVETVDQEAVEAVDPKTVETVDKEPVEDNDPQELVGNTDEAQEETEESIVEDLIKENEEEEVELRPRDHIAQLLKLDAESEELDKVSEKTSEILLRDLKKLYENAIKPLEMLYKYRDLSNRHFGDSEIFSKPLILFMGPWSGGKSTIINYLLDIEHNEINLHTGAEPSPAYFNILMYGEEPEILDGTELAADHTFSGLQKFGQGLEERLKGYKFPSKLLEKVNIVEIPGILEVRKQVSRIFPFNDACQWFIDRADIIFLVYDPSKLDVGPETEAILDQLKGREHQTRIVLNKADQVKPEELMRVQGALIWNISPLMSSAQPPVMYTTSLWSQPYEQWAPVRLLQAQERAFLKDLRSAIDKRIDNKIASARRFAVRVRNHAKMVDCYLTTYYNHKSVFGNRKQVSDEIINHPQDYHIYEGLSTLTNISRYDLPDPDVYRDFFRLNALYDFQQLSSTCTYFRGCPINRLDVAIAYDLPELVGKHKRLIESAFNEAAASKTPSS